MLTRHVLGVTVGFTGPEPLLEGVARHYGEGGVGRLGTPAAAGGVEAAGMASDGAVYVDLTLALPPGTGAESPDVPTASSGVPAASSEASTEFRGSSRGSVTPHLDSPTLLRIRGAGVRGMADSALGRARATVPLALVHDEEAFGVGVLETLVLFLVTACDRRPVHAAGVLLGDRALLVAGPSGTGKSTLAYAAHRAGLEVLGDDAVYLQSDPTLRIWGAGRRLALPADAGRRFPELSDREAVRRADGRVKLIVSLPQREARCAPPAGLCLLRRGHAARGRLEAVDPERAVSEIVGALEPGFDRFTRTVGAPLTAVAEQGAWRLDLPEDPAAAVALLREIG